MRAFVPNAEEIDTLLPAVVAAAEASTLPDRPDFDWIDAFVGEAYLDVVRRERP